MGWGECGHTRLRALCSGFKLSCCHLEILMLLSFHLCFVSEVWWENGTCSGDLFSQLLESPVSCHPTWGGFPATLSSGSGCPKPHWPFTSLTPSSGHCCPSDPWCPEPFAASSSLPHPANTGTLHPVEAWAEVWVEWVHSGVWWSLSLPQVSSTTVH